jgi:putative peptidoglycan lipid II flippase
MQFLGLGGLALATALSSLLNLALLLRQLRRRLGRINGRQMATSVAKLGLAGGLMAVACWLSMTIIERRGAMVGLSALLMEVLVSTCLGVAVYLLFCRVFRCSELGFVSNMVRKWLGKGGDAK